MLSQSDIKGLSLEQLKDMVWQQEKSLRAYHVLLAAIPPCLAHGEGCIAGAYDWVQSAKKVVDAQREHDKEAG